jgi:large subunit ribosomal protein L13
MIYLLYSEAGAQIAVKNVMKIIDATGLVLGRLATVVAKLAMNGNDIVIVNAEKAIVTGAKKSIQARYKQRRELAHPRKGPYYPRMPDRILKRAIRGMIPYQTASGRKAYKRIKVYIGVPKQFQDQRFETISMAANIRTAKFMELGELSRWLGAKV